MRQCRFLPKWTSENASAGSKEEGEEEGEEEGAVATSKAAAASSTGGSREEGWTKEDMEDEGTRESPTTRPSGEKTAEGREDSDEARCLSAAQGRREWRGTHYTVGLLVKIQQERMADGRNGPGGKKLPTSTGVIGHRSHQEEQGGSLGL